MEAMLALEDGTIFKGSAFGARGERFGEVVFNTSMAGYQEILTDPSYKGQIVTMTYPLIGNYGTNPEDVESRRPFVEGFVVRECSNIASNWRCRKSLDEYLRENNIIGLEGIDTRALTRHIRLQGAMKGVISTDDSDEKSLARKAKDSPGLVGRDLVKDVTFKEIHKWNDRGKYNVVVLDTGVKYNILRQLVQRDCKVTIVPAGTSAKQILGLKPDGVLLANGPGDPEGIPYVVETVKRLLSKVPIFGICMGNHMLVLALGGKTYKLKFGHHGGNHPVKDLKTGKVHITVQNHGFCGDIDSLNKEDIEVTHINLNDNTLEGIRHRKLPIFSVQFHPEAGPGPHDARYMFSEFVEMMERNRA
ncbi:MAG: glutamine-hydrolyzing carbamoyl-phosphate synthase small subunit [Planctomycetota bacterium]|jgi:carbamoyl-phosphate synthase small subunit